MKRGGTNKVTRENGNVSTAVLYTPWGEVRYEQGEPVTDRLYTGQPRIDDDHNLYYYGARWYDPSLGRFLQADTILPVQQGTQGWDRYAYVNNNPAIYKDPTGHQFINTLLGDGGGWSEEGQLRNEMQNTYGWGFEGDWTLSELNTVLDAGKLLESKVSEINGGLGIRWMQQNTRGTVFLHGIKEQTDTLLLIRAIGIALGSDPDEIAGAVPDPSRPARVVLGQFGINIYTIIHELGHVVDNLNGSPDYAAVWFGGGPADELIIAMGGTPEGLRFFNDVNVDVSNLWKTSEMIPKPYGNTATAEYFAESLTNTLLNPRNLPNSGVGDWMIGFIRKSTP